MFRAATEIQCSEFVCPNLATTTIAGKPVCRNHSEMLQARSMRLPEPKKIDLETAQTTCSRAGAKSGQTRKDNNTARLDA